MATIHISEADAARDFPEVLSRVRAGEDIIIDGDSTPVMLTRPTHSKPPSWRERIALLPKHPDAVMDEDFARDVQAAIDAHREPLDPPAWD